MSGIGKGISTASIGRILEDHDFRATAVKIDPYINVDAGTMNPIEHGEVFVTEDGVECDQDIGNYERFLNRNIYRANYMTTGLIYQTVINRERNLEYAGKCVEVVPHIPEEVISRIKNAGKTTESDFVLIEVGGTVGEYQNLLFLEAGRMMKLREPNKVIFVLVSYLPVPNTIGEMKTKPTQYAVRSLNSAGIQPDIILARSQSPLDRPRKEKLSVSCNTAPEDIISAPDVKNIYEIPINFEREKLSDRIFKKFGMRSRKNRSTAWQSFVQKSRRASAPLRIGIVGKYFNTGSYTLSDSYISVIEAVKHASWSLGVKPEIDWLDAETYEKHHARLKELSRYKGIIVPGGFGARGVEGKILAINYLRKHGIPFLGLCYGLQLAVVEFARNQCGLKDAHTTEVNAKTKHPVIHILPEQLENLKRKNLGGSMRLGAYACRLKKNSSAQKAYSKNQISERHRHRYEVNNEYRAALEKKGLVFSGINPEKNLVEIIELQRHPFFLGTQFHPELKSRPLEPHPLFLGFIGAAKKKK